MGRLAMVLGTAALLLAGCASAGDETDDEQPVEPADTGSASEESTPTDSGGRDGSGPDAAQPPADDETVARTGPVRLTRCFDGAPEFGYDGTVTAIDRGRVTFEVHESFFGDVPASYVVELGEPVSKGSSETPPSYSVGSRLLVQGADGRAGGCGDTVYFDEETAAEWRTAS